MLWNVYASGGELETCLEQLHRYNMQPSYTQISVDDVIIIILFIIIRPIINWLL
jgi:hypothetical protein